MIEPLHLDGITYTRDFILSELQPLLDVRDALIEQNQLPHAMAMSVIHALLIHLAENTE